MVNVFEDTETGDPTKNATLADLTRRLDAVDLAVSQSAPYHEAVRFSSCGMG